jgi:hypothetical protein
MAMIANGKVRLTVTTDEYQRSLEGSFFVADVLVRSIEQTEYSLLEIRLIMPGRGADDLLLAMVLGRAEFSIGEIQPVLTTQQ